jgi:hypothetical protein
MTLPVSVLLSLCVAAGLALSADRGSDWNSDDADDSPFAGAADDDYESPFADETDKSYEDANEEYESPFADEPEVNNASEEASDAEAPEPSDESDAVAAERSADSPFAGGPDEAVSEGGGSDRPAEAALATMTDARGLCDEAMDALHDGHADRAFERLATYWAFSPDEMTQLQREVERTRAIVAERYGTSLDCRFVREDAAADALVRFVYLERYERHGLRWRFTFYRGATGWTLNDVYFDDEIEALLG